MARDVRRLRNALEEVEEVLADRAMDGDRTTAETLVLTRVTSARDILRKLDLSLQSSRCSRQEVDPGAMVALRYTIETATDELSVAFDAMTSTGEIELRLDTSISLDAVARALRGQSAATSAASSKDERKSSIVSSALTSQSSATDVGSLREPFSHILPPSDEKEVYDMGRAYLLSPAAPQETRLPDGPEPWRSPWASPDPMSGDIEAASRMLLGSLDEDVAPGAMPTDLAGVSYAAKILSPKPQISSLSIISGVQDPQENVDRLDSSRSRPSGLGIITTAVSDKTNSREDGGVQIPAVNNDEPESARSPDDVPLAKVLANILQRRMTEESLKQDGERLPAKVYSPLEVPRSRFSASAASETDQRLLSSPKQDVSMSGTVLSDDKLPNSVEGLEPGTPSKEPEAEESAMFPASLEASSPSGALDTDQRATKPSISEQDEVPISLQTGAAVDTPVAAKQVTASDSLPPTRAPPPPPKPRRARPRAPSAYRITNASLNSRSSSPSSIEDLYVSSRPTSPISRLPIPPLSQSVLPVSQSQSPVIPQVSVDKSALTESAPPKVPPRPLRYAKNRAASMDVGTGNRPVNSAQNTKSGSNLQVDDRLGVRRDILGLRPRWSVDESLHVSNQETRLTAHESNNVQRSRSVSAPQRANSGTAPIPNSTAPGIREFYSTAEVDDGGEFVDLDGERLERICRCWNSKSWDEAEQYLMGYLESLIENDDIAGARRARHLLGVCASYKGQWQRALTLFVSVLNTPIKSVSDLDEGDCAAAYWLGDTYSLLNRRTEALLAYCIAERRPLKDPAEVGLQLLLVAEQECVQLGVTKEDFKPLWAHQALDTSSTEEDSILNTNIIATSVAKICLETEPRKGRFTEVKLSSERSRAAVLHKMGLQQIRPPIGRFQRLRIDWNTFHAAHDWPMIYDPLFNMANVQRGRLLAFESNILDVFGSNKSAKLPKCGPVSLSRFDTFTCNDLQWLINTLRQCLKTFDMEWSEVANVEGTWFCVRHSFIQERIAQMNYFSIALFRQSMRSGYGIQICPDGMCGARMINVGYTSTNGVHQEEPKRIKKLIREYLDQAAKEKKRDARVNNATASVDGEAVSPQELESRSSQAEIRPPPVPPRIRMSIDGLRSRLLQQS